MLKIYIVLLTLFLQLSWQNSYAQYENIWIFGKEAGLDFNTGAPVALKSNITGFGEGSASVCDAQGNLLFYTEGSFVWDRNGNLMPHGEKLTDISWSADFPYSPTSSASQGTLIVPIPNHPNDYYIFSLTSFEQGSNQGRLYYSVVRMDLNGGLGDVIMEKRAILLDSFLSEQMAGIAGNHCNIWLVVSSFRAPELKSFEITNTGVNHQPVISTFQYSHPFYTSMKIGRMAISPDRKKLGLSRGSSGALGGSLELYDFDPATGILSNLRSLFTSNNFGTSAPYGVCFSPDNTKLYSTYSTGSSPIDQYDISSGDAAVIINSKTRLGTAHFTDVKLAPDGKIYFATKDSILGAINFPNLSGAASQYNPAVISLVSGTTMHGGLSHSIPTLEKDTLLTIQDVEAGCFATKIFLAVKDAQSGWDYRWNNGSAGSQLTVDKPGIYWVSYFTSACNYHVDTFNALFPYGNLPVLGFRASCKGAQNGLAWVRPYPGDDQLYDFTWYDYKDSILARSDSLLNFPAGEYKLHIATTSCDTLITFYLPEENHLLGFNSDSFVCVDKELLFKNNSDARFREFQWQFGDGNSSLVQDPIHTYHQTGSFKVTLTGTSDICSDTIHSYVQVDSILSSHFTLSRNQICEGESVLIAYQMHSNTIRDLYWLMGDGAELHTMPEEHPVQYAYDTDGNFPVIVRTQYRSCPESTFMDFVVVAPLPKIDLGDDHLLCITGSPFILQPRQQMDGSKYHFRWNTGDTSGNLIVNHYGKYSLTARDKISDCSNTATITISKNCFMDIPNAFTPNGDGVNDYFFPRQLLAGGMAQLKMKIYNRWGQLLFETSGLESRGWDGRFNFQEEPIGVYVYWISVSYMNGVQEEYQGDFTLLR